GQKQPQRAEYTEESRGDSRRQRLASYVSGQRGLVEPDLRVKALGQIGDGGKNRGRIVSRLNNEIDAVAFIKKILPDGKVKDRFYLLAQHGVCGVLGDADDLHQLATSAPHLKSSAAWKG